jgi:uncharacterized protein (TIGR02246 family)
MAGWEYSIIERGIIADMNRSIFAIAILLSTFGALPIFGDAIQDVRRLERQWLDAYEQRDPVAMKRIVADDFSIVFPDGSGQTKADILSFLERSRASKKPGPRFTTEEVQARAYGDTVILSGRVITHNKLPDGTERREVSRYTDTYVRRKGQWQVVASHLSNAPAAK